MEKPQANMTIDADPFHKAPINIVNLNWEKGNGKTTWEEKENNDKL